MDYNKYKNESKAQFLDSCQESNSIYKRHFLDMGEEVNAAISFADIKESKHAIGSKANNGFDAVITDGDLTYNNTEAISVDDIAEMKDGFYEKMLLSGKGNKLISMINAFSRKVITIEVPSRKHADLKVLFENHKMFSAAVMMIKLNEGSSIDIFELHQSKSAAGSVISIAHVIEVGEHAGGEINILHNEEMHTNIISLFDCSVGKKGSIKANLAYVGGSKTISRNNIKTPGEDSNTQINEVVVGSGQQKFDIYTYMENTQARTSCCSDARAIMAENSRCYIKGFAKVLKGAKKSKSHIKEYGIILDRGAHIDMIPDMSIEESDVDATHLGQTAPISEEMLFYIMSKGLNKTTAQGLVAEEYSSGILSNIKDAEIRKIIAGPIRRKIYRALESDVEKSQQG
ncbi:MAG: SufD family Fe-S cluster assembly protein [Candidatus Marsarchaeota archaeon]|jgi:Fe-S cluster assembly protein SufD|nr:SufD family Fe-S cluster assembly protein [Candidatus Marsarchaeota archaeon]